MALELVLLGVLAGVAAIGLPRLCRADITPASLWVAGWVSAAVAGVLQILAPGNAAFELAAMALGSLFACLLLAGARLLVERPATRRLIALAVVLGGARALLARSVGEGAAYGLGLAVEPALVVAAAASVRGFRPNGRLLAAALLVLAVVGALHLVWLGRGGPVSLPVVALWLAVVPALLAVQLEAGAAWARRSLEGERAALEVRVAARSEELARANASLRAEIAEHRATEAERERLAARVRAAERLESLGLLAAGVAHDFDNVFTVVLGQVGLADADLQPGSLVRARLERIREAARHGVDLAEQMLVFAGRGPAKRRRVDLARLVAERLELARAAAPPGCAIDAELACGVWVDADATQLRQVVLNLVQNAAEARGGAPVRVSIRAAAEELAAADLADAHGADGAPPGRYAVLEVADDGPGIDAATAARIFDPFFTTKPAGRGLGLAAVLGIVRGHGGAVKLDTAPGAGTRFRVLLPLAESQTVQAPAAPAGSAGLAARAGRRVLVVDDDDGVLELARELLVRAGYEVATAAGGREALARVAGAEAGFDVAVVDLGLPDMDGEQAVRELRRALPGLPVVVASGRAAEEAAARLADVGGATFLAKPWRSGALEASVAAALLERGEAPST